MGQDNSALLGAFLISSLHSAAALARKRRDLFPVYVDEAYLFGRRPSPKCSPSCAASAYR